MSAQATPPGSHPGGFPTIARVGVRVNEAGVEYLFSKSLDQLLGYLGRPWEMYVSNHCPAFPVLPQHMVLTSCTASPRLLMPSMSFTLQPSQKSAVSTRWERGRGRVSSAGGVLPYPEGKLSPAHLAGPVPVHPWDNNIAEVL